MEGMHTQARALAMGMQASPWGEGRLWAERVQPDPREGSQSLLSSEDQALPKIKTDHPLLRLYYWSVK